MKLNWNVNNWRKFIFVGDVLINDVIVIMICLVFCVFLEERSLFRVLFCFDERVINLLMLFFIIGFDILIFSYVFMNFLIGFVIWIIILCKKLFFFGFNGNVVLGV